MNEVYEFGGFRLDPAERLLCFQERPIRLRPKVFDTLCALASHAGRLVHKEELMALVWPGTAVEENNLALSITVLRKALREADPERKWIETVTAKGYRFVGPVRAVPGPAGLGLLAGAPPVGAVEPRLLQREAEMEALRTVLRAAVAGRRQFACITGEAGLGKTALVQAFLAELSAVGSGVLIGTGQCVEHSGQGEAYMPMLEALGRICQGVYGKEVLQLVGRHAPSWLAQLPSLVEPQGMTGLQERLLGVTQQRMLREACEAVEAIARRFPVVIALEDLHWGDPSTLELVGALARRKETARFLLVGTNRGRDAGAAGKELESVTEELEARRQCRVIRPSLLAPDAVAELILEHAPGSEVSPQLAAEIHSRSSGNPLFAHTLVEYWRVRGAGDRLPQGVPGSLRAMIERKLERLPKEEEELLETASVAGMTFTTALVAAVGGRDEEAVEARFTDLAGVGALVRPAGLEERPDGRISSRFTFGHSLFQEVLYERIPHGRRARLHRGLADRMEKTYGAAAVERSGEMARHFLDGREPARALKYLAAAAEAALRKSAHREAAGHLRRGVKIVGGLPETPENQAQELDLVAMLAPTLIAIEGFASREAESAYERARELGERLGDGERLSRVMLGRAFMLELRGEYRQTEELLGRQLRRSVPRRSATITVHAGSLMACSLFHQGRFAGALEQAERALRSYNAARDRELLAPYGENPSVACRAWAALCLWFLGYPDRAARQIDQTVSFSGTPEHRFTLSTATLYATHVHQLRGESEQAARFSEMTLRLAEAEGYPYNVAFAKVVKGWAAVQCQETEEGLARIDDGLALAGSIGAKLDRPYLLALSAEARMSCGRLEDALEAIAEALSLVEESRTFFYEAELHRLRAVAQLRRAGNRAEQEAEADLQTALGVAREQGARSLELRAATELAALLGEREQAGAARELLEPLYASFSEGFQTRDLRAARNVLDRLGRQRRPGKAAPSAARLARPRLRRRLPRR